MSAITGKPQHAVNWSVPERFEPEFIERAPPGFFGVYLVRLRYPGCRVEIGDIVYVGQSEGCIRKRLRNHYRGKGNRTLRELRKACPRSLWFQYAECVDPVNAEAWFIHEFQPIANERDESPKQRVR